MIRDNRILLFMKGTPEAPVRFLDAGRERARGLRRRVRSARRAAALQPLREVTAEISDWQTFPQLYVNSELIGGADIVEEMDESGELAGVLGVEQPERPAPSAEQEPQADNPQQSPPIQIER